MLCCSAGVMRGLLHVTLSFDTSNPSMLVPLAPKVYTQFGASGSHAKRVIVLTDRSNITWITGIPEAPANLSPARIL